MFQELTDIISNIEILPGIFLLKLRSKKIAESAKPGQFVMLSADDSGTRLLRRPISLHKVIDDQIHFLFAVVGEGTEWLSRRSCGQKLDVLGPVGNGFNLKSYSEKLLLVAGGMGIAPLVFLADQAKRLGKSVKLVTGARTSSLLLPSELVPAGVEYFTATEDGSRGEKGFVTGLLQTHSKWADQIFICGPLPMFKAIAKNQATLLAGKPAQVSLEVRMGCGMAICYSCTIRTSSGLKQVCHDGPVFDIREVDWDSLK